MRRSLLARHDTRALVGLAPATLARALESLVERSPADLHLDALTAHAQAWASLEGRLRGSGLRIEAIVRWDEWSATAEAVQVATGRAVLARVLRPEHRGSESRRRLARHARVLSEVPGLDARVVDGDSPAIIAPLPGGPLLEGPPPEEPLAIRGTVRILGDLVGRETAGLGRLDPDRRELRQSATGGQVVSLHVGDEEPDIGALATDLEQALPNAPAAAILRGAITLPPTSAADLADVLLAGLAQHLAHARHEVVHRWRLRSHHRDKTRLATAIQRLANYPPPAGTGAIGVDMDGRTTVVTGDGERLTWGPAQGPQLAIISEQGLHVRTARRMLRARSAAPHSERLDESVGGDAGYSDRACRWVAAAVSLRTIQKLLSMPVDADSLIPADDG